MSPDMSHGVRGEAGRQDLEEGTKHGGSRKTQGASKSQAQVGAKRGAIWMPPPPPDPSLSWVLSEGGHCVICRTVHCNYPQDFRLPRYYSTCSKGRTSPLQQASCPQDQRESKLSPHPFSALWLATVTFPAATPFKAVLQRGPCFWAGEGGNIPSIERFLFLTLVPPHR